MKNPGSDCEISSIRARRASLYRCGATSEKAQKHEDLAHQLWPQYLLASATAAFGVFLSTLTPVLLVLSLVLACLWQLILANRDSTRSPHPSTNKKVVLAR
jgi:hypothetical protein